MKKKYYESQFGKQHERVAPKKNKSDEFFGGADTAKAISALESWALETNKARMLWEERRAYYEARVDKELELFVLETFKQSGEGFLRKQIERIMEIRPVETVTFDTIDGKYGYRVTVCSVMDMIRKVNLEKAEQERAIIEKELCTATKEITTRTGGRL